MALTPSAIRTDLKCGNGAISKGEKCHKGPSAAVKIGAAAGGVALAAGAVILVGGKFGPRRRSAPGTPPSAAPTTPRPSGPPRLPGSTPYGLLTPARIRKSKTQRMYENTAAAVRNAEQRLGQTAREEVRRIAQIGNTMAAAGEASGMAAKTGLREVRLRVEAARRRYEPGYRRAKQQAARQPERLTPSNESLFAPGFDPIQPPSPVSIDPRTGQPRRRKAQGFGS